MLLTSRTAAAIERLRNILVAAVLSSTSYALSTAGVPYLRRWVAATIGYVRNPLQAAMLSSTLYRLWTAVTTRLQQWIFGSSILISDPLPTITSQISASIAGSTIVAGIQSSLSTIQLGRAVEFTPSQTSVSISTSESRFAPVFSRADAGFGYVRQSRFGGAFRSLLPKTSTQQVVTLIALAAGARAVLLPYAFEASGETARAYVLIAESGFVPGFNYQEYLRAFFLRAPAIYSLSQYLTIPLGIDGEISLKIVRNAISLVNAIIVYRLTDRLSDDIHLRFGVTAVFTLSVYQLWTLGSSHFKNYLGMHLSLVLLFAAVTALQTERDNITVAISMLPLLGVMVLSHRLYLLLLPSLFSILVMVAVISRLTKGYVLTVVCAAVGFIFAADVFSLIFVPDVIDIPQFKNRIKEIDYLWLLGREIRSPGIVFYNVWALLGLFGGYVWLRRESDNNALTLLFAIYMILFLLSKDYLFGFHFEPGRFRILIPPFLALFSVYGIRVLTSDLDYSTTAFYASFTALIGVNLGVILYKTYPYLHKLLAELRQGPVQYLVGAKMDPLVALAVVSLPVALFVMGANRNGLPDGTGYQYLAVAAVTAVLVVFLGSPLGAIPGVLFPFYMIGDALLGRGYYTNLFGGSPDLRVAGKVTLSIVGFIITYLGVLTTEFVGLLPFETSLGLAVMSVWLLPAAISVAHRLRRR